LEQLFSCINSKVWGARKKFSIWNVGKEKTKWKCGGVHIASSPSWLCRQLHRRHHRSISPGLVTTGLQRSRQLKLLHAFYIQGFSDAIGAAPPPPPSPSPIAPTSLSNLHRPSDHCATKIAMIGTPTRPHTFLFESSLSPLSPHSEVFDTVSSSSYHQQSRLVLVLVMPPLSLSEPIWCVRIFLSCLLLWTSKSGLCGSHITGFSIWVYSIKTIVQMRYWFNYTQLSKH